MVAHNSHVSSSIRRVGQILAKVAAARIFLPVAHRLFRSGGSGKLINHLSKRERQFIAARKIGSEVSRPKANPLSTAASVVPILSLVFIAEWNPPQLPSSLCRFLISPIHRLRKISCRALISMSVSVGTFRTSRKRQKRTTGSEPSCRTR